MKIKAIMLALVLSGACLFGNGVDKINELLTPHEYTNNMGVKQYRLGNGDLEEIFKAVDMAENAAFNYANPENSRDLVKAVIGNINKNIILHNRVLQDEADAYMTQKEVSALQLKMMRLKKEIVQLQQEVAKLKQAKR
ncbi:hypothetical protein CV726_00450 [Helicobacter pylori]|uniref:hypothetical protein n=1 Tax=Helicobacter pylori TaxID=210 RepID=UPI0011986680|nr:hypothetical protein [Helicobacter pylori]QDY57184.1 hypothetical protein CV726_00450 [Helicobacter pylori]